MHAAPRHVVPKQLPFLEQVVVQIEHNIWQEFANSASVIMPRSAAARLLEELVDFTPFVLKDIKCVSNDFLGELVWQNWLCACSRVRERAPDSLDEFCQRAPAERKLVSTGFTHQRPTGPNLPRRS